MTSIADVAALAGKYSGITGINWQDLNAKGRGSVWDRDYQIDYMFPAFKNAEAVYHTYNFDRGDTTPAKADSSFKAVQSAMDKIKDTVLNAARIGLDAITITWTLDAEALRHLLVYSYATAIYGYSLHDDETIHHSGLSDAEISAHADNVVAMFNCITAMEKFHVAQEIALNDPAAPAASTSGLGAVPLIAIIIVAIAVFAIVAYLLYSLFDVAAKNLVVANMCARAQASGDAAATQQCIATLSNPASVLGTKLPSADSLIKTVMPYVAGGIAIYALIAFAPEIIRSIKGGIAASKA